MRLILDIKFVTGTTMMLIVRKPIFKFDCNEARVSGNKHPISIAQESFRQRQHSISLFLERVTLYDDVVAREKLRKPTRAEFLQRPGFKSALRRIN